MMGISLEIKRSLVVDDDADFRQSLIRRLKRMGYQSSEADSSEEAIQHIETDPFDIIFLDLDLPGIHGSVLLKELDRQRYPAPVVVMSGSSEKEDVIDAFRSHAVDFLIKPFGPDALTVALDRAAERRAENEAPPSAGQGLLSPPPAAPQPVSPQPASPPAAKETADRDKPSRATSIRASVARVVAAVRSKKVELPVLDPMISHIQELVQQPDVSAKDVVKVIERDPALVAAVLRTANTAYYQLHRRVSNLEEACMRLGNKQVFSIVLEIHAQKAFVTSEGPFASVLEKMWRNSYVSARLARRLAEKTKLTDPSEAYLVTLLHNVGELLLIRVFSELGEEALDMEGLGAECHRLHERFGETLTSSWKLGPTIIRVASHHHEAAPSEKTDQRRVRNMVLAAWTMAFEAGFTYFPGQDQLDSEPHLAGIGLSKELVTELLNEAKQWTTD